MIKAQPQKTQATSVAKTTASNVTSTKAKQIAQNKENQSVNAKVNASINKSKAALDKQKEETESQKTKDFLVSTTSETNTLQNQEHESSSTTRAALTGANNRYADSNLKSTASDLMLGAYTSEEDYSRRGGEQHQTQMLQQEVPFYMSRQNISAASITDEDVESFQKKLDTMIINFRSETMSEFMKTKKQVIQDQASAIDGERRRCNTLLGVKQNEIEQLKEGLGNKTKLCDELTSRCEGMAFWAGKSKMLLRIKLLQHKSFEALKAYWKFKKHTKRVLEHRLKQYREDLKRKVFQGWGKQYKEWKIVKNREDFEKAVKLELQNICAQYNKEIESLREKLNEANQVVDAENRNKAMMQENLKKAFMRGVCALNFEAMSILNPADQNYQSQIEKEMERQVINAMSGIAASSNGFSQLDTSSQKSPQQPMIQSRVPTFSNVFQNDFMQEPMSQYDYNAERKLMQIETLSEGAGSASDYKKVESKDSLWKPAPIMGREINQQVPSFTYAQPTITSTLRNAQQQQQPQQNYVLPSHFSKLNEVQVTATKSSMMEQQQVQISNMDQDTELRSVQQPLVVQGNAFDSFPSSLPNIQYTQPNEGKMIFAQPTMTPSGQGNKSQTKTSSTIQNSKKTGMAASKKKL